MLFVSAGTRPAADLSSAAGLAAASTGVLLAAPAGSGGRAYGIGRELVGEIAAAAARAGRLLRAHHEGLERVLTLLTNVFEDWHILSLHSF